jgi:hypothetical protein
MEDDDDLGAVLGSVASLLTPGTTASAVQDYPLEMAVSPYYVPESAVGGATVKKKGKQQENTTPKPQQAKKKHRSVTNSLEHIQGRVDNAPLFEILRGVRRWPSITYIKSVKPGILDTSELQTQLGDAGLLRRISHKRNAVDVLGALLTYAYFSHKNYHPDVMAGLARSLLQGVSKEEVELLKSYPVLYRTLGEVRKEHRLTVQDLERVGDELRAGPAATQEASTVERGPSASARPSTSTSSSSSAAAQSAPSHDYAASSSSSSSNTGLPARGEPQAPDAEEDEWQDEVANQITIPRSQSASSSASSSSPASALRPRPSMTDEEDWEHKNVLQLAPVEDWDDIY